MKRITSLFLILTLIFLFSVCAKAEETDVSQYINNEVLVMYDDNTFEVISYEDEEALKQGLNDLENQENVSIIQPNYSYISSAVNSNDELSQKQWALENDGTFYMEEQKNEFPVFDNPFGNAKMPGQWRAPDNFGRPGGNFRGYAYNGDSNNVTATEDIDININEAWEKYTDSGKEVIVAMVDTGVDYTHSELSGRIWTNDDEIASNGVDDDGNGYIDDVYGWNFYNNTNVTYTGSEDNHGTHGAGTIIAKANNNEGIAGIIQSDNVKVMSVKALGGSEGGGSTASVISAIQYAEANGAEICNLSLGTSTNDMALYQTIANSNMLFIVAAGNDSANTDYSPSYPASYDLENIISVANLNYDGTLHYSSNYGETSVDLAAPGSYILSTTSNGSYSYMTGTSMAAPFVSGAAALVYSHYGDISLSDVKQILLSSVTKLESLDGEVLTGGMLNLSNALSFNLDNLSDEQWEVKNPVEYKGSAPVIKTALTNRGKSSYLALTVYDEDNDLSYVSYASGKQTAQYFNGGSQTEIEIANGGTVNFEAKEGTYTFYAVDTKSNETVYTVTMKEQESSPREATRIEVPQIHFGFDFGSIFRNLFAGIF